MTAPGDPQPTEPEVHEGEIEVVATCNLPAAPGTPTGVLNARFVRYPGCQQLSVWLPQSVYTGYGRLRLRREGHGLLEDCAVRDRVGGSVKMLFDTLAWPPGDYVLEVEHGDGWRHELRLRKRRADNPPPPPAPPPPEPPRSGPIRYRDGFGREVPDEDLALRARAAVAMAEAFAPGARLSYSGTYRAGTITYLDGDRRIEFWHEMAAAPAKFFIDIPPPSRWEAATGVPLAEREAIVRFVAERVRAERAGGWRFEIDETSITFY